MPPRRVDLPGVATLLGLAESTVRRYARGQANGTGPVFPTADASGRFAVTELREWAQARPGKTGRPVGKAGAAACQRCGNVVAKRWPDDDLMVCKPCYLTAGES